MYIEQANEWKLDITRINLIIELKYAYVNDCLGLGNKFKQNKKRMNTNEIERSRVYIS